MVQRYGAAVLHLRLILPEDLVAAVLALLAAHPAVTNVTALPGAGHQPKGDLITADVAREAASDVLGRLRGLGLHERGSIAVEAVDLSLSAGAEQAEAKAPGYGSDAVVWEDLEARVRADSSLSVGYLVFFGIATMLAGIAVLLDSAILVVGAMIVGPEYGPLAGLCIGLVLRRLDVVRRSALALAVGFTVGIAVTIVFTLMLGSGMLVEEAMLTRDRPQTGFIYEPDPLSFVVAFLAGIAGMMALTAAKSGAVLGVLVSVTTIPAAGNVAVALAFSATTGSDSARRQYFDQAQTSAGQLLLNLLGIVLAGVLALLMQRLVWKRVRHLDQTETAT